MPALMWFRADLRVRDNKALAAAARDSADGVLAVFALCPKQWRAHDWGENKVEFLLRNIAELRAALGARNIPLAMIDVERFDDVPAALLKLADQARCHTLYFNEEYEVNEQARDAAVQQKFEAAGKRVHRYCDQIILDVAQIRTGNGDFYSVFTPFKKKWIELYRDADGVEVIEPPKKQPTLAIAVDDIPTRLSGFPEGNPRPDVWPAGEAEAARRLKNFIEARAADYADDRDYPAINGTSTLSPYLALGVISPRQCLAAALDANQNKLDSGSKGVATWISELIWREFYRHVLIGWPRVCKHRAFKPETEKLDWHDNDDHFDAWAEGRTGVPIVDAGMRQLRQTGWMHNRVRMIVAMFFSKNLFLDWRRGERWFMQQLVDGDLASNNGGWQWSASTGTDAAPYFRIFNSFSQGAKFDEDGVYVRKFVPEIAPLSGKQIHAEPEQRDWPAKLDYPKDPIVDVKKSRAAAIEAFRALGD